MNKRRTFSPKGYLSVSEFSRRSGLGQSTVRKWIALGKIRAVRRKCVFCSLVKRCKRGGKCNRVLVFSRWRGLKVGYTIAPSRARSKGKKK